MRSKSWHLAILTGFALAFGFVLLQVDRSDDERHEIMFDTIRQLETLNSVATEEVLRIRVGDVQNYDRLSAAVHEFGLQLSSLEDDAAADVHHGAALEGPIERYGQLHASRLVLIEDFKSKSAILSNSLAALPVLLPSLVAELQLSLDGHGLANRLKDLATEIMLDSLTGDDQARRQAIDRIRTLARDAVDLPEPQASRLNMLLAHSRLILHNGRIVQQLLEDILSQPIPELHAELRDGYSQVHNPVQEQARLYRTLMVLIGGLFLGYIIFFVLRLQRTKTALAVANGELQEAQSRAEEAQDQLLEAVEAMDEGFALFDADDRLVLFNSAYRGLHPHLQPVMQPGRDFEDLVRANVCSGLLHDAVGREEQWIEERMRSWRQADRNEMVIRQGDRWFMHRDRRTASGKMVAVRADVTSLKEREAELAIAKEKAVLADRAKSEFLANMSHEIRTPMNGIMGMAQLLAGSELNAKQKMYADVIVKSGDALVTIINDILDFSKIDAGRLELDPQPFELAEAVEDVAALFSTRTEEKGLELAVRIQPGLPEVLVGDVGRLRQIVANLVGNAVKFTERGHVVIDVSGKPAEGQVELMVKIADTGIGIPPDKVESIFEQFSQVDGSTTRKHEGTGLGLTISKRLVEKMGGEIGVESKPGEGSTFWFTIALPVDGEAAPRHTVPSEIGAARILVVDDNEANRAILLEQLASWQFEGAAQASGDEGLAALRQAAADHRPFDLLILDHNMPVMGGVEVAQAVRADPAIAATPIVMLTSVEQLDDGKPFREIGVQAHLVKPARFAVLLDTLVTVLHEARHGGSGAAGDHVVKAGGSARRRAAGAA